MEARDIELLSGEEKKAANALFNLCNQREPLSAEQLEEVDRLLGENADLVGVKSKRCFPLYYAAGKGHVALCRKLLDCGADVDALNDCSNTALMAAAGGGHDAVCELLIERGASKDIQDEEGHTALSHAASAGRNDICKFLIEKGVSLFIGYPLHKAARAGKIDTCRLLLSKGIPVNQPDDGGNTALHEAAIWGRTDTCRFLIAQGAEIDALDNDNQTPLKLGAEMDEKKACRVLLLEGANPDLKDVYNQSAYDIKSELIDAIIREEKDKAEKNFHPDTPPAREQLFTDTVLSDTVKGTCLVGLFGTHIARPLLQSRDPKHPNLLQDVLQSLPRAWKNATAHQYTLLERKAASRQYDPQALR